MPRLVKTAALASGIAIALLATAAQGQSLLRVQIPADIRSIDPGVNRDHNTDAVVKGLTLTKN